MAREYRADILAHHGEQVDYAEFSASETFSLKSHHSGSLHRDYAEIAGRRDGAGGAVVDMIVWSVRFSDTGEQDGTEQPGMRKTRCSRL